MNIFEELIEELKEENLLEETVISRNQENQIIDNATCTSESVEELLDEFNDVFEAESSNQPDDIAIDSSAISDERANLQPDKLTNETVKIGLNGSFEKNNEAEIPYLPVPETPPSDAEFYSKRATDEVAALQIVEHVFSGVEREQMKVLPKPFDDLGCKKALHTFLQVSDDPNNPEHAKAEFQLMQETESWFSALTNRDRNISVSHLRRYCETTRPVLSPTALVSLARFYRNSPYSELVRSKFDLVLTRLFTKETINEKRELPFSREELIKHLNSLYSHWASIPLYSVSEDDSEITQISRDFEEFITEVEKADSFDELIKNDFFNRLRRFKESTNENFFAPLITAIAIECNVRVGNRFVDLIQIEKEKMSKEVLEDKYGFLHDQAISESSSKTLQLIQIINRKFEKIEQETSEKQEKIFVNVPKIEPKRKVSKQIKNTKFNRGLLAATILIVIVNVGLYFWMGSDVDLQKTKQNVEILNIENSAFREYIVEARLNEGTFFGIVQPNWSELKINEQEEVLKMILNAGESKRYRKAHLLDKNGRTVAFADENGIQIQ